MKKVDYFPLKSYFILKFHFKSQYRHLARAVFICMFYANPISSYLKSKKL